MSRSYLFRRPKEDDEIGQEIVKAKPLDERFARRLGDTFIGGREFVRGSEKSQAQFHGENIVEQSEPREGRSLSHDERNKLQAKILKAELKGNHTLASELRRKLQSGVVCEDAEKADDPRSVLLMQVNKRTGLVAPATRGADRPSTSQDRSKERHTIDHEYRKVRDLQDMVAEEKRTSADDQLKMFSRSAKMTSDNKVDDDWVVDDNLMSHPKKRRHEEKDKRKEESKRVKEHRQFEKTLDSCKRCVDSKKLEKESIVAIGFKTYLAVVTWDGLDEEQCLIVPCEHYSNSLTLDEDVFAEMRLWRKGLTRMWQDEGKDCIFIENFKNVSAQTHMTIECIPIPQDVGDMIPIYFKKAIMESDRDETDNPKLLDLSKHKVPDVRSAVPKGFPFFSVDFGLQPGYAHVIEDDLKFPSYFAQEVVGNLIDVNPRHWRNPQSLKFDDIKKKKEAFAEKWDKYDWTKMAKHAAND